MFRLHHLGQHGSGLNVLADLHREIDQYSADSRSNSERIELLLFKCGESARLVYLGLLLSELSFNGFLVDRQPLAFEIISGGEFVRFALG